MTTKNTLNQAFADLQKGDWHLDDTQFILESQAQIDHSILGDNFPNINLLRNLHDGTTMSYNAYGRQFTLHIAADVTSYQFMDEVVSFMATIGYHKENVSDACADQVERLATIEDDYEE